MNILVVIASIFAITGFAWLLNKKLTYKICPICAGVSGTWLWLLGARFLGYSIDSAILAMLLGASVVGIAYQLEKKIEPESKKLLWKVLFIPVGFAAVYGIVQSNWYLFVGVLVFLVALAYAFLKQIRRSDLAQMRKVGPRQRVEGLEEKMKQCC